MNTNRLTLKDHLRIILAITGKDILEAIKNKSTISVIITSLFVVIAYRFMPSIMNSSSETNLLVYDAGSSGLVEILESNPNFVLYEFENEADLLRVGANGDTPELSMVIPPDFSLEAGSGTQNIEGHLIYWINEQDAQTLITKVEDEIWQMTGQDVSVEIQDERLYPQGIDNSRGVWAGMSLVFMMVMIGVSLIPHLILEEKKAHTIDALLVSPANSYQFTAGKAMAGIFYCLVGGVIVLVVYSDIILHWWLAIAALLATSLFVVSIGLWLGMKIENRGQLTMLAWIFIIPLFLPMMLFLLGELFPAWLIEILKLVPTVTGFRLLLTSFSSEFEISTVFLLFGWTVAWAALVLMAVRSLILKMDRGQPEQSGLSLRIRKVLASIIPGFQKADSSAGISEIRTGTVSSPAPPPPADPDKSTMDYKKKNGVFESLRLVWVIAAKDIRDALHNKLFISILIGVTIMAAQAIVVPLLFRGTDTPAIVVYDEGSSAIIDKISETSDIRIIQADSFEEMKSQITDSPGAKLGLVIPGNIDELDDQIERSAPIMLDSYIAHWQDKEVISEWIVTVEEEFRNTGYESVAISSEQNLLYPGQGAAGQPMITLFVIVIAIVTIGASLVPILFIEEKETHTLDVLMVSPANKWQVAAGKLVVGLFYGALAAIIVLLFNNYIFVNWGVAILASLTGIFFAGAIGVLLGVLSDNHTSAGLWGGLGILLILSTSFLRIFQVSNLPPVIQSISEWLPGTSMINLFNAAIVEDVSIQFLLTNAAVLIFIGLLMYIISAVLLQRRLE